MCLIVGWVSFFFIVAYLMLIWVLFASQNMDDWGEVKSQNGGGGLLGKSAGRGKTMRAAVDLDAQVGAMSISGSNGVDDEWRGGPAIAARAPAVVDDEWGGGQAVAPKAAVVDDEWGGGSEAAVATSGAAGGDWLEESAPRGGGFVQNGGGINGGGGFGQNGGRMNGGSDRACFKVIIIIFAGSSCM